MRPIPAGVGEQAQQLLHAGTRRRDRALNTWLVVTEPIPAGEATTSAAVRQGPQMAGSEPPKMTTTGSPNAAAMCAGPESLPINKDAELSSDLICSRGAPATVRKARINGSNSPPSAPMNTGSAPVACKCSATAKKPSARQVF